MNHLESMRRAERQRKIANTLFCVRLCSFMAMGLSLALALSDQIPEMPLLAP